MAWVGANKTAGQYHAGDERDRIEARWLADPPETAAAFAEGDRLLEEWKARVCQPAVVGRR